MDSFDAPMTDFEAEYMYTEAEYMYANEGEGLDWDEL